MGNSSARDKDLLIYIETQKQYYNSGSHIEGVVFVEAKKNFQFNSLYIRVQGDEWCQWFEGSSKNRKKHTGSQNFYAVQHLLASYAQHDRTLEAGRYAYPFSLELSQNIPGSFESSEHDAKIVYKLAAYFVNQDAKNNAQIEYIPLHIREPFRQQMVSYQGHSTQKPTTCGCFNKGVVKLDAKFDRNVCYEGQCINIEVKVDNSEGKTDLDHIVVDLVQNIFVSANSGVHRTYRNSVHKEKVDAKIKKGEVQTVLHSFKINTKRKQTAIGTLVANHYRLEVSTQVGMISADNPCIYCPLFVLKEKDFDIKGVNKPGNISQNPSDYSFAKMKIFRAPEYWFKKNMNLSVMNFRLEEGVDI